MEGEVEMGRCVSGWRVRWRQERRYTYMYMYMYVDRVWYKGKWNRNRENGMETGRVE